MHVNFFCDQICVVSKKNLPVQISLPNLVRIGLKIPTWWSFRNRKVYLIELCTSLAPLFPNRESGSTSST